MSDLHCDTNVKSVSSRIEDALDKMDSNSKPNKTSGDYLANTKEIIASMDNALKVYNKVGLAWCCVHC